MIRVTSRKNIRYSNADKVLGKMKDKCAGTSNANFLGNEGYLIYGMHFNKILLSPFDSKLYAKQMMESIQMLTGTSTCLYGLH